MNGGGRPAYHAASRSNSLIVSPTLSPAIIATLLTTPGIPPEKNFKQRREGNRKKRKR
jgi:hypothetical protein